MPTAHQSTWKREFSTPIPLADGGTLSTLEDARVYLAAMAWKDMQRPEWRAALTAVLAAALDGSLREAEQAMITALRAREHVTGQH